LQPLSSIRRREFTTLRDTSLFKNLLIGTVNLNIAVTTVFLIEVDQPLRKMFK
jgi:hypothetical protein